MTATATATDTPADYRTERQTAFLLALIGEVFPLSDAAALLAHQAESGMFSSYRSTSAAIDQLIAKRDAARAAARQERAATRATAPAAGRNDVRPPADGRYAVEYDGALRFYSVVTKRSGTWLNRFKSDDLMDVTRAEKVSVYAAIHLDPAAARTAFAVHSKHCTMCGRRLTEGTSRDNAAVNGGYGPECVKKLG